MTLPELDALVTQLGQILKKLPDLADKLNEFQLQIIQDPNSIMTTDNLDMAQEFLECRSLLSDVQAIYFAGYSFRCFAKLLDCVTDGFCRSLDFPTDEFKANVIKACRDVDKGGAE